MDTVPQTIEESWDQDSEAHLSAQCIAERLRSFSYVSTSMFCSLLSVLLLFQLSWHSTYTLPCMQFIMGEQLTLGNMYAVARSTVAS